jgi:alkane 1-monooxygenase
MTLRRLVDLRFLLGVLLPALTLWTVTVRPGHAALGAAIVWVAIVLLELLPPLQRSPAPPAQAGWLPWILRAFVPLELAMLVAGLHAAAHADILTVLGLAFGVGFVTGAQGITFAHELGHSRHRADRALGWILMGCVNYGQFMVEHYRGHHVRAATWGDPASARRGESLWRFLPRTLGGSWGSAWKLEARRLQLQHKAWIGSPLAWCAGMDLAIVAALAAAGQGRMLAFWLLQSAFAVWLLETVNYIEHYGLQRRAGANGRPEPFGVAHAWNTDTFLCNSLLANLQRHSDHHVEAWKRYPQLQALPQGPQLPTGYAGCIFLAAVPAVWFALMHRRMDPDLRNSTPLDAQ